jgi:hypothetical protein
MTKGAAASTPVSVPKAGERTRTADPFITSEVLYQLSYAGGATEFRALYPTASASL